MDDLVKRGSQTAKDGFQNEKDVGKKFQNFHGEFEAKKWLKQIGHDTENSDDWVWDPASKMWVRSERKSFGPITRVDVIYPHGQKSDLQVNVFREGQETPLKTGISAKLVSNLKSGFNQVDKRWVNNYEILWSIPQDIVELLKMFSGEISSNLAKRDSRRVFLDELNYNDQQKIIQYFEGKKQEILIDVLQGRGEYRADYMLVAAKDGVETRWALVEMETVLQVMGTGLVQITPRGSLKIGKITMQRKGGDNGRESANMLQFKMDPCIFLL